MRDIKFRVFDHHKDFELFDYTNNYGINNDGFLLLSFDNEKYELANISLPENKTRFTIQQFTGLKDHKRVDCYEGDIVRYFNLPPFEVSYGLLGEVQFINGCFCIKCRDKSKGGNVSWITEFDELDYFEVVGNVIETPEILK